MTYHAQSGLVTEIICDRRSLRRFGVPERGPCDPRLFQLVSELALSPDSILEVISGRVQLEADQDSTFLMAGIGCQVRLPNEVRDSSGSRTFNLASGERAEISASLAYIGRSGLVLPDRRLDLQPLNSNRIRFIPALQLELPLANKVRLNHASNRAGFRLDGWPSLNLSERVSEPCCTGAIQATPSGQLIVIGPDGPTIGGYPVIGFVVQADQGLVAHLTIGEETTLEPVTFEAAVQLAERQRMSDERLISSCRLALEMFIG